MSIKQAIEALPPLPAAKTLSRGDEDGAIQLGYTAEQMREYALAALRSMPAEPYAYAVHFPSEQRGELVHDLDELLEDMTNLEHEVTPLFATPHTEAVRMSEAEYDAIYHATMDKTKDDYNVNRIRELARAVEQATAERLGVKMGDV